MNVRTIQLCLAAVFFVLGGWCLVSPSSVIGLCIAAPYRTSAPLAVFSVGCFGSQALIGGLFAAFSEFKRATFLAYAIALVPFFGFDWYFTVVVPFLTPVGLLDAVGNAAMLALCVLGWRAASDPKANLTA